MKNLEESKQTVWETWFVISIVLIVVMFVTGLMDNSKVYFPNWPYFAAGVLVNVVLCIKRGTHRPKE